MSMIAKVALGLGATLAMTTAYVFHEGVIRVDVDENRPGGNHVHLWVPATTVSAGMRVARFAPHYPLEQAGREVQPYIPLLRKLSKELQKYPNAEFVKVTGEGQHVHVATAHGRLQIDAVDVGNKVHVSVPVETLQDVVDRLEEAAPRSWDEWRSKNEQVETENWRSAPHK